MTRRPPARGLPLAVRLLESLRRRPWDLRMRRQLAEVFWQEGHYEAARAQEAMIEVLAEAKRRQNAPASGPAPQVLGEARWPRLSHPRAPGGEQGGDP